MKSSFYSSFVALTLLAACKDYTAPSGPVVQLPGHTTFSALGDSTTIANKLTEFRTALGGVLNAPNTPPAASGRREINWDGVPAAVTNVDNFPAAFFNETSKRGALLATTGTGLRVDSTSFGALNPALAAQFAAFSPKKTFAAVGSNDVEVEFRLVGLTTVGLVNGFGVVFSDVDRPGSTRIELFDAAGTRIANLTAPARNGSHEFSFVGATFDSAIVASARVVSGEAAVNDTRLDVSDGGASDLVVMDDFIYGEPQAQ